MNRPVAFITGASSGIGLATARFLASSNYHLMLFDRDGGTLEAVASELETIGAKVIAIAGNIACEADLDRAMSSIRTNFGCLDAVVANAGINGVWAPIDDLSPDEWDTTIRVNLRGTYLTLNRTVPLLKEKGAGSIVIVASINGVRSFTNAGATAYSATKAAQVAMTYQLALELARAGIRINVVCPGAIDTNIDASTEIRDRQETEVPVIWPEGTIPLSDGEPGMASDVAETIRFLLSDAARHITGTPVFIDGGQGLLK
ncbi:SDR family NAD(P)-dependent oxidoreductase [Agrobacterium sp.]|jgi:NAD(P)-dependent dehydrogenase (short-subunit alcohol dehydrogenase family)|uniref:SDR family oxidoreductase n=1 Tax=Agrobacterium sp. TaxID=361 RepID=UPI0028ABB765|nr:SDR family NAD(P)-dependent oxidoreductase [Agrobacterium sp.]